MKKLYKVYKVLIIALMIGIPCVAIFGAFNIVLRMPDVYTYEFNNAELTSQIDLGLKDEELGKFFSDFMVGKEKHFDLFAEYRGREQSVFGTGEKIAMENARSLLNKITIVLAVMGLLTIINYSILILKKEKLALRFAFKGGIAVYAVCTSISIIIFNISAARTMLQKIIFVSPFGADDVLPLMLTEKLASYSFAMIILASAIILILLGSLTWRLTKPRRMFW